MVQVSSPLHFSGEEIGRQSADRVNQGALRIVIRAVFWLKGKIKKRSVMISGNSFSVNWLCYNITWQLSIRIGFFVMVLRW